MCGTLRKAALAVTLLFCASVFVDLCAQVVRGTVYDTEKPVPMAGATVVVRGKNIAAFSDASGKFEIKASPGDVLNVQFMGYVDENVTVGKAEHYEIVLTPDREKLDEAIVTALGMKREKRSLGYAATDISGEQITEVQSSNWLNGLAGKVAGVQFNNAASGPIGSMKAVVRGESSLNGNSSALFVIDGVPMSSGTIANASGSTYTNDDGPVDFGDGATDLNPDDIESVTVLKGAAATALYGSRAGNGAIVITTRGGMPLKDSESHTAVLSLPICRATGLSSIQSTAPESTWERIPTISGEPS